MNFGETLLAYWPILTAAMAMIWWFSRSVSHLENKTDRMDERLKDSESKITQLFTFFNQSTQRRLDKLDRLEEWEK